MSGLYPLSSIERGSIRLNALAELLMGKEGNNASYFNIALKEVCDFYVDQSDGEHKDLDFDDVRGLFISLEEARRYCKLKKLKIPSRIKAPETLEELGNAVLEKGALIKKIIEKMDSQESEIAALNLKLENAICGSLPLHSSQALQLCIEVTERYWVSADIEDRDSWKTKDIIVEWLLDNKSISRNLAIQIQSVTRPEFARTGGRPPI